MEKTKDERLLFDNYEEFDNDKQLIYKKWLSKIIEKMKNKEEVKIACYGDSITWGYLTFIHQSKKNYPKVLEHLLQKKYKNHKITVYNLGKNSMTSQWGIENIDEWVISKSVDIVFIMFGINDTIYGNKLENYINNLKSMCDRAVINNILPIFLTPTPVISPQANLVNEYAQNAKKLFIENNYIFVDTNRYFKLKMAMMKNPLKLLPDTLHLMLYYHEIAKLIMKRIFFP